VQIPDPDGRGVCGRASAVRPAQPAGKLRHPHEHLVSGVLGPALPHGAQPGAEAGPRQATAGPGHGAGRQALVQAGHDAGYKTTVALASVSDPHGDKLYFFQKKGSMCCSKCRYIKDTFNTDEWPQGRWKRPKGRPDGWLCGRQLRLLV
jgi:hypothetical protein